MKITSTICVFILLILSILALGSIISGGHDMFLEGLESADKKKIMDIMNNKRLTNDSKIQAIIKLNIDDPRIKAVLNKKTKNGQPASNTQKSVDLLKAIRSL